MSVDAPFQRRVSAIASRQRGRVARAQLLAASISSAAVARAVHTGYLLPVHRGVYAVGHLAHQPGAREAGALLALRPGAALSHLTALRWWTPAFEAYDPATAPIHLTLPGERARGPEGVVVHRSTILTARDLRVRDGLPITSPARTLLDLAAELAPRRLERALDTGLVHRLLTLRDINELLARAGRHAGCAALRELTDTQRTTTFTRSEAEERLLGLVRDADLRTPLVNVHRHGFEIDFLWLRDARPDLAVEIDGYAFHATRAAFERDRRRDEVLRSHGIETRRITWRRLVDEPFAVVAALAAELGPPQAASRKPRR